MVKDGREPTVAARLAEVQARMADAAAKAGRAPGDITLVGVTKGIDVGLVKQAVAAGLYDLGENRMQEWMDKAPGVGSGVRWHYIGQLQTNKVRYLRRGISVLHSLDRLTLLTAVADRWSSWSEGVAALDDAQPVVQPEPVCLVQVNVAQEASKAGLAPAAVDGFLARLQAHGVVRVGGLMTVAPYTDDPESVRWVFAKLRDIRDAAQAKFPELDLAHLSMGMSGDFEQAVSEGATIVRLGSAIFGPRG